MEPLATDARVEWLIDADDPRLDDQRLAQVADPLRPDRLAWNTFRTLALWNTDTWVPALLEVALGADNRLSPLDWSDAVVVPWGTGVEVANTCDVVLDGPEAYVVILCSLDEPPDEDVPLRAAAINALDGSVSGAREAGCIVVAPQRWADERLQLAGDIELRDGRLAADLLEGAMGAATWADLGKLALDLAEEGDPDVAPVEQVRQLVMQIEAVNPGEQI